MTMAGEVAPQTIEVPPERCPRHIPFLMHLLEQYMIEERATIMDNNVRVRMLGRRDDIPEPVLRELDKTVEMSGRNSGLWLNLAFNYGGRAELVGAGGGG